MVLLLVYYNTALEKFVLKWRKNRALQSDDCFLGVEKGNLILCQIFIFYENKIYSVRDQYDWMLTMTYRPSRYEVNKKLSSKFRIIKLIKALLDKKKNKN